ncbi:Gfo/Idh/MocA family protein [Lacisediminihabitans profunda]|uniref:Gfo/Idh/MocA family oxidoreductase n=1 Tax=Lacisediminihabitans profunda TaxID=2594790 RepID=A0A5C8UYH6_9MICO|nr:Gfo/Idh/MocA family oxidoreductase [Lacisediminihabitans profunda]TXN32688.1 Gfo/Idh/MocA family oxidoreductase [Lacisediminihabitans profunda]
MTLPAPTVPAPTTAPTELRVGVIGLGFAGTTHLDAYTALPGVTVVALAGQEESRLAELGRTRGVPNLYHDWQDLVARDDLDIVSIGVPNHLHHPIALAALASGKHVFCEKPLATTGALAAEMTDAALTNNRVLEIAFNHRRRGDVRLLKDYLASTELGRIYHARASWRRRSGIPGIGSWFTNRAMSGGGPMIDLGSHVLDIVLYLLGEPRVLSVSAVDYGEVGRLGRGGASNSQTTGGTQTFEVEDFAFALLRLDNGASIQLEASWADYTAHDNDISVDLLGSMGGASLFVRDHATDDTLRLHSEVHGASAITVPRVHVPGGEHRLVIEEFLATIRSGQWANSYGEYALHRSRVLDAVYESARINKEVNVA